MRASLTDARLEAIAGKPHLLVTEPINQIAAEPGWTIAAVGLFGVDTGLDQLLYDVRSPGRTAGVAREADGSITKSGLEPRPTAGLIGGAYWCHDVLETAGNLGLGMHGSSLLYRPWTGPILAVAYDRILTEAQSLAVVRWLSLSLSLSLSLTHTHTHTHTQLAKRVLAALILGWQHEGRRGRRQVTETSTCRGPHHHWWGVPRTRHIQHDAMERSPHSICEPDPPPSFMANEWLRRRDRLSHQPDKPSPRDLRGGCATGDHPRIALGPIRAWRRPSMATGSRINRHTNRGHQLVGVL